MIKKDAKANAKLAGAVFALYSDANCTKLLTKLPATDANGEASVQIIKAQDTIYLKEITAPNGYRINATAYNVKLEVSKTTTVTVPDEEQLGQLTVYKEGEVLVGADVTERMVQHLNMRNADRKVLFTMCMPEQILKLLMVQKFTARVIW